MPEIQDPSQLVAPLRIPSGSPAENLPESRGGGRLPLRPYGSCGARMSGRPRHFRDIPGFGLRRCGRFSFRVPVALVIIRSRADEHPSTTIIHDRFVEINTGRATEQARPRGIVSGERVKLVTWPRWTWIIYRSEFRRFKILRGKSGMKAAGMD